MSYTITVKKSPEYPPIENPPLFIKHFDSAEDFQAVAKLCDNKRRISWPESLIVPVRTETLENLRQDLLFPGLFHEALKTKEVVNKIFLYLLMLICDVITLPIRLITVIPCCIYNTIHSKEAHPFYQYLINNGVATADLSADHVYLETQSIEQSDEGRGENLVTKWSTFNFIHLHSSASDIISGGKIRRLMPETQNAVRFANRFEEIE